MKKQQAIFSLLLIAALFYRCNDDDCNPFANDPCETDADSLYVSTPYNWGNPFPPLGFPNQNDTMVANRMASVTEEGVQLGRMLFYDPILSKDSSTSCASCHKQEYAFSDGGKTFSTNVYGQTRRHTPTIFNMLWSRFFFWDGRSMTLDHQSGDALHGELGFHEDSAAIIQQLESKPQYVSLFKKAFGRPCGITRSRIENALGQFMLSIVSTNSKFDKVLLGVETFDAEEQLGFDLFRKDSTAESNGADCFHCHAKGTQYMMNDNLFHNNGLDEVSSAAGFLDYGRGEVTLNPNDNGKFKTPSIRNISYSAPYMHDGRFATLDSVLGFYDHGLKHSPTIDPLMKRINSGGLHLGDDSLAALKKFLLTLDDPEFITNPKYANPF